MSDENLIQRCLRQNKPAWDEFVEKYSSLVCWAIKQRLGRFGYNFNQEDVWDIHQDVFFCIWKDRKLAQLKDKNKIAAWLSMIAGNKAVDYFKLVKRQKDYTISIFEEGQKTLPEEILSTNKAAESVYTSDINDLVTETLEEFSHEERIILKFNLLYQKKHQEIAETMNLSVNTVSTIISRSKEKLKEKLIRRGIKDF